MSSEKENEYAASDDSANISPDSRLDIPEGERPDLFEYLASLPDVDDADALLPEETPETQPEGNPENKLQALAEFIRSRAKAAQITPLAIFRENDEDAVSILENISSDENYKDIVYIKSNKDTYYYSNKIMTDNFANIAVLVEEKDNLRTLAHCVRERSAYPALTYSHFFADYPFYFTADQMTVIKENIKNNPAYEDIQVIVYPEQAEFFYSTQSLKPEIASYLADELLNERP